MSLSLKDQIAKLRATPGIGKHLAEALRRIEDAINGAAKQIGIDATKTLPAPPPIHSLNVKTSTDGFVHVAITDNQPISRNLQYFVEYDTDPAFGHAHQIDLGAARTYPPFKLPALNDSGGSQTFYFRAYSQYHGSAAGKKVNFGGTAPTGVTPGGTTQMTLLSSTGSGTAKPDGSQAGQGLGPIVNRPAVGPKRITR